MNGHPLSDEQSFAGFTPLSTISLTARVFGGKVHGSLARAGKVKGQTPKVEAEEKKKKKIGRHTSELQSHSELVCRLLLEKKNAHKFNFEKAKVFTWMAVMMKNRCIDRIRAKKRRIPLYEVDDYTESSITEPDSKNAVDILKQKEKASIVLDAVKQLPDPQREVIELVFYKEMTHVQVAEHLGISIGTAKSRIRYAYQRLRDALSNNSNLDRN